MTSSIQKVNPVKSLVRSCPLLGWSVLETLLGTMVVVAICLFILNSVTSAKIICAIGLSRLVSILIAEGANRIRAWAK
jgi:hypothetical protein